uniref:Uncharacterized protein n=1 Tax=Rhizophora mucronata TaxID=61149 RepID=A0A2P2NPY5_RHIMU
MHRLTLSGMYVCVHMHTNSKHRKANTLCLELLLSMLELQ